MSASSPTTVTAAGSPPADAQGSSLSRNRRMLILAICCMSLFIVGIDVTIVNIALPSIQRDLNAQVAGLQWVIDAYTLVLASFLLLAGSTADRVGRRRIFQIGLVLFTAGSVLCGLAPSLGWLIAFRVVQALGGSMLNPVAMSIITNTFTDPKERARAIGVWGGVIGLSMALGPVLGGLLVDSAGWRSVFWVNLPVGLAALVLTARFVPESRAPRPRRIDPVGQSLVVVILASVIYAIIEGPGHGWTSAEILGLFALAAVSIVALVVYEQRRTEPLIDLRFFRSVPFSGATLIAVTAFICLSGFLFVNALYLQDARGYSPLVAGLCTLPMAAMVAIFAPVSGRLVAGRGARLPLVVAGTLLTIAAFGMSTFTQTTSVPVLLVWYALFGIGFGLVNAPITNAAVSGMPRSQAGVAAAFASTSRQLGSSLGVALIGATVASRLHASAHTSFTDAAKVGWYIMSGSGLCVLALGIISTSGWARATAQRAAAAFEGGPTTTGM
ncbi:MAG TPA: MFS transporter [Actinocrinis sp.]|nr:MFS transporter [Actinocrinis sp.]